MDKEVKIYIASAEHLPYVDIILHTISEAAKVRGTGIAKRDPEYVKLKISEGKAIIALAGEEFAGFCYIESWGHDKFVANSGLIVADKFRGQGLARDIKRKAFDLSRKRYPNAKIFGLTTGLAVMKINSELGYKPVTFRSLPMMSSFGRAVRVVLIMISCCVPIASTACVPGCFMTRRLKRKRRLSLFPRKD